MSLLLENAAQGCADTCGAALLSFPVFVRWETDTKPSFFRVFFYGSFRNASTGLRWKDPAEHPPPFPGLLLSRAEVQQSAASGPAGGPAPLSEDRCETGVQARQVWRTYRTHPLLPARCVWVSGFRWNACVCVCCCFISLCQGGAGCHGLAQQRLRKDPCWDLRGVFLPAACFRAGVFCYGGFSAP